MGANVEVVSLHVEVLLHSRDICIVYIGSIKVLVQNDGEARVGTGKRTYSL